MSIDQQLILAKDTIRELLEIISMVEESNLTSYTIDPYGKIGDALRLLGESTDPDSWTALHRLVDYPDPPPITHHPAEEA